MTIFFITVVFFVVIVLAMAVGYIFQKKTLAGSCGGLASVGIEKDCHCENPCEKRQAREKATSMNKHDDNKIEVKNL